jgi:hypothetical protein
MLHDPDGRVMREAVPSPNGRRWVEDEGLAPQGCDISGDLAGIRRGIPPLGLSLGVDAVASGVVAPASAKRDARRDEEGNCRIRGLELFIAM